MADSKGEEAENSGGLGRGVDVGEHGIANNMVHVHNRKACTKVCLSMLMGDNGTAHATGYPTGD